MDNLQDRVALITGASSGIGAALARELAQQNVKLVLLARRAEKLAAIAAEIDPSGQQVLAVPGDVTKEGDIEKAVNLAHSKFGKIEIAIANAGFGVKGNLSDLTVDDYRRQWETNVFGVLRTIYATLDDLKQTKGRLAIIGSVNGYVILPGVSPYVMSKFALRALWESLSSELAPYGISVIHICPGFVATESRLAKLQNPKTPKKEQIPSWMLMSTTETAQQIVQAISRRKREVILTGYGKLAVWLKRHLPGLLSWLLSILKVN
ncbi:MAG: SDR family oxidoreductase [Xenococcaceae cyanobacterium MO_167.B27]|nr:SDR family oxidoreductase [Xenococcaceae cyanobacterium MO_167.B27]